MIRPSHAPPRGRTAPLRQSGQRLGAAYGQVRCADSLAVFAEVPVGEGRAEALASLGLIAQAQGGRDEARALFAESVMRAVEAGAHWLIAPGLEGLAEVAAAQGQHERAVRLLGAAEALRARVGVPRPPARRVAYDRTVTAARAALDTAAWAAAWAEGQRSGDRGHWDALMRWPTDGGVWPTRDLAGDERPPGAAQ